MKSIGSFYTVTIYNYIYTIWLFNIAMENGPFIDDFPIKTSIYKGFSMAMLNNQMVYNINISHVFPETLKDDISTMIRVPQKRTTLSTRERSQQGATVENCGDHQGQDDPKGNHTTMRCLWLAAQSISNRFRFSNPIPLIFFIPKRNRDFTPKPVSEHGSATHSWIATCKW